MIQIAPEYEWYGYGAEFLDSAIEEALCAYCKERAGIIETCDLRFTVDEADVSSDGAVLRISIDGSINGSSFRHQCKARRQPVGKLAGGIDPVHLAAGVITSVVSHAASGLLPNEPIFNQCFTECISILQEQIDLAAGIELSPAAHRWKLLGHFGLISGVIAAIGIVCWSSTVQEKFYLGSLLFAGFGAAVMYMLIRMLGFFLVPKEFFLDEAIGRLALSRTGVSGPIQARLLICVIFAALGGFVFWFFDSSSPD